ncbi:MAG TPA: SDR family oxidoreductase [Acidimicrobiia bacterium]|nr:SDR family oxidoreductase [Acidimicrobiia bacterium]
MQELRGRVAVVTGAGSGIGRAAALAFARAGVAVVVADLDADRADTVAGEARAAGGAAIGVPCDVCRDGDLEDVRDRTLDELGRVDIVMNNVGLIAAGPPLSIPLAEWQRIVDTNLLSIVRSNLVFLPLLLERGEGHVVNTASTNGLFSYSYDRLPYTATKSAVVGLTEALALYLKPRGVGVSCLCPGPVATNIVESIAFHGDLSGVRGPDLELLDPAVVGDLVVDAVRGDRFLVLTHPQVRDIMMRRAADPDGFLADQIAYANDSMV